MDSNSKKQIDQFNKDMFEDEKEGEQEGSIENDDEVQKNV